MKEVVDQRDRRLSARAAVRAALARADAWRSAIISAEPAPRSVAPPSDLSDFAFRAASRRQFAARPRSRRRDRAGPASRAILRRKAGGAGARLSALQNDLRRDTGKPRRRARCAAARCRPRLRGGRDQHRPARHAGRPPAAKAKYLAGYHHPGGDCRLAFSDRAAAGGAARSPTRSGFHYRYDAALDQYIHPAGFIVAAPDGTISRYMLGVDMQPSD